MNNNEESQNELAGQEEQIENNMEQKGMSASWNSLSEKDMQAIKLRFLGKTSGEIAEAIGSKAGYVRKLFMQGGRLEQAYNDFVAYHQKSIKDITESIVQRARVESISAMERMIELSQNPEGGAVTFKANEYLLSMAGASADASLRDTLRKLSFDQAMEKLEPLFIELYGRPIKERLSAAEQVFIAEMYRKLLKYNERERKQWKNDSIQC